MSVAKRNKEFRKQVEKNKAIIREESIEQNKGIAVQAYYHQFIREGNYAAAQALEELMPEIDAAGLNANGHGWGEQQREDLREELLREERERARQRDREKVARMFAEGRRKAQRGIDLDAARNQPHTTTLAAPSHLRDSEQEAQAQERYRQEMKAYEQRRRDARYEGVLFTEPAPTPPGKKENKRGPIPALPPMDPQVYR